MKIILNSVKKMWNTTWHIFLLILISFVDIISQLVDIVIVKPIDWTMNFIVSLLLLPQIKERIQQMAINLEALAAEVSNVQSVQASAVALLNSLTKELEKISADLASKSSDTATDTAALNDLIDKLKTSTDSLAAAVANTPKPLEQK